MDPADLTRYAIRDTLLDDRILLITGAAHGIGRALTTAAISIGARIVLLDRDVPALEQTYDTLESTHPGRAALYPMDLEGARVEDYRALAKTLEQEYGRLDGLVNNAGWVGGLTPLELVDATRWTQAITVNLHAPFLLTQACLPLLKRAADPSVVFSTHECHRAYWGAYGVAKQGLHALLRILAAEHRSDCPVRFNGVDSGVVATRLRTQNYPGEDPNQLPEPEEVLGPYLYFLGPDSRGVTGTNFEVQAGMP